MKKHYVVLFLMATVLCAFALTGCSKSDEEKAKEVGEKIDDIYVEEWTKDTEEQCKEAKEAWDALTDEQKELVTGENADPDYFGKDTGDASKDDPLNEDEIGEKEILVVSFGTSYNNSRVKDIGGIEKAIQKAYPKWSVRRAFTAQIIINHILARDNESIDNVDQALQRAVDNKVKTLVIQPTHLMHGAEYDELMESVEPFDTAQLENFKTAYLAGYYADRYDVAAKDAVPRANERMQKSVKNVFDSTTRGYIDVTPLSSHIRIAKGGARYALFPVWIMNTTWHDEKFVFAMNGQTGKFVGNLPCDNSLRWKWHGIYTGIFAAALVLIELLINLM